MTTVRNDAVVEAMRQVASNDSVERRTMLFQMLADSRLIVPTAGPPGDGTTSVQLAGGPDGSVLAVFTDLDAFGRWAPPGTSCAALEAVALFRTAVRLGVVRVAVNPGSDPTGELTPREFTSLAEGRVPVGASTDFVQPGTTMQFGRPRVAPSPVGIDAVRRAIHDNGAPTRAFSTLLQQGDNDPGTAIALCFAPGTDPALVESTRRDVAEASGALSSETNGWLFLVADAEMELALEAGSGTAIDIGAP